MGMKESINETLIGILERDSYIAYESTCTNIKYLSGKAALDNFDDSLEYLSNMSIAHGYVDASMKHLKERMISAQGRLHTLILDIAAHDGEKEHILTELSRVMMTFSYAIGALEKEVEE